MALNCDVWRWPNKKLITLPFKLANDNFFKTSKERSKSNHKNDFRIIIIIM